MMRLAEEEGGHLEPADHDRPVNKRKKAMRYTWEDYWKKKTLMTVWRPKELLDMQTKFITSSENTAQNERQHHEIGILQWSF